MISDDLEAIHKSLLRQTIKEKQWIEYLQRFKIDLEARRLLNARERTKYENPYKTFNNYISKCRGLPNILPQILSIGQKVIWRTHIEHELVTSSKINCRILVNSLSAFNE